MLNRILTWPILLDPGHSLLGHSEAMGTTTNLFYSGEDSERGADNRTRGSAEMMRINCVKGKWKAVNFMGLEPISHLASSR